MDKLKTFIDNERSWRDLLDKRKPLVNKSKKLFTEEIKKFKKQYKESFLPLKKTSKKHDSQEVEQFYGFVLCYLDEINTENSPTTKYYEYTKRRLNHLHDCVCIHPNHVDKFYDIVTEVYCKDEMRILARDLVFSDLIRNSVEPQISKLIDLLNEFESNMDDFELSEKTFNPRKCYKYEGSS